MKIRADFVTNSSSSSFILGFKSEDTISKEIYDGLYNKRYFDRIYKDVMSATRLSEEEAEDIYRDYLSFSVEYDVLDKLFHGWSTPVSREYRYTQEFKDRCKAELENQLQKFKKDSADKMIFVEVEYGDHIDPDLEHKIMPALPSTIRRMSNH